MRLRNESHQSNTKKIVPGSAAWQAAKSDRIDVKEAVDNDDIDDIVSVEAKTVTSKWSFIGVEDMNGFCLKSTPAILPSNSILCTTVHTGKEYVYGIAQSVMEFGKDGICYSLLCQGITLLPIGKKWITLALKCNGKSVSSKAATEDNHDDTKITEMEIDICELIFDHLAELRWNEVKENEQLCHLVKLLFEK